MTYPGQPPAGKVLWGASLGNQNPVTRHDHPAGTTMEIQRLFFRWPHVQNETAYKDIQKAIDAGRFPWVSFKLPVSWDDVSDGKLDTELGMLLTQLDSYGVPIWLTMHHEPEGGEGINNADQPSGSRGHRRMNAKVRELMTKLDTKNIALSLVLMGWTWDQHSGRSADEWWDGDTYDFIGVDHYVEKDATLVNGTWRKIRKWAKDKGVDVAVGEWGVKGDDTAVSGHIHDWYEAAIESADDGSARVVALCAFDVPGQWHAGTWVLPPHQLTAFHEVMRESALVVTEPPATEPPTEPTFTDVPADHPFFTEIEWFAKQGITRGCNPPANDEFCPDDPVTREQMAVFLYRALNK